MHFSLDILLISCYRWRCTFLFSLIFGIPTIFVAFINVFSYEVISWPTVYGALTLQEIILFVLATIIQVSTCKLSVWNHKQCIPCMRLLLLCPLQGKCFISDWTVIMNCSPRICVICVFFPFFSRFSADISFMCLHLRVFVTELPIWKCW